MRFEFKYIIYIPDVPVFNCLDALHIDNTLTKTMSVGKKNSTHTITSSNLSLFTHPHTVADSLLETMIIKMNKKKMPSIFNSFLHKSFQFVSAIHTYRNRFRFDESR